MKDIMIERENEGFERKERKWGKFDIQRDKLKTLKNKREREREST